MVERIGILGTGRFGSRLCTSLRQLGYDVQVRDRERRGSLADWAADCAVLCLACRDDQITAVVSELTSVAVSGKVVMFHSGATDLHVLDPLRERGARIGKFHPLMAFSQPAAVPIPQGTPFAYEGPIEDWVRPWVTAWKGQLHPLEGDQWQRYHLAAVLAANFLPLLIRSGAKVLNPLAPDEQAALDWLAPLVQATVAQALNATNILPYSGPAVRGDETVLQRQEALLETYCPEARPLYHHASQVIRGFAQKT